MVNTAWYSRILPPNGVWAIAPWQPTLRRKPQKVLQKSTPSRLQSGAATSQYPSTNGQFARFRRQAQIVILEILPYIPAVTIFAFLELEQIFSFVEGH